MTLKILVLHPTFIYLSCFHAQFVITIFIHFSVIFEFGISHAGRKEGHILELWMMFRAQYQFLIFLSLMLIILYTQESYPQ